jgi:hypothetical protein
MSLFSTYSTGENRVTASVLAVLKSLSLGRIERLLGELLEQSEFELVRFQNQPAKGGESVPDAMMASSCRLLIETKIKEGTASARQLRSHLKQLDDASESTRLLLVLTPDQTAPKVLETINDPRVIWASFERLNQSIDGLLKDEREVISEREAFLLRELQAMFEEEGLIGLAKDDVLVVAARHAWPEYQRFHAYVCQPKRHFRPVQRIAFYSLGRINELIPRILTSYDEVLFEKGRHKGRLGELVEAMLDRPEITKKEQGHTHKVMLLSAPDHPETIRLDDPIINDKVSQSGQITAFTMGHCYVACEALKAAKRTSELAPE